MKINQELAALMLSTEFCYKKQLELVVSTRQVNDKLVVFIEPYGDWQEFSNAEVSLNAGFLYRMKNHLQWDFSLGTGLNHTMNFFSTGISWMLNPSEKESSRTYSE